MTGRRAQHRSAQRPRHDAVPCEPSLETSIRVGRRCGPKRGALLSVDVPGLVRGVKEAVAGLSRRIGKAAV
jgi:hypothetical protein